MKQKAIVSSDERTLQDKAYDLLGEMLIERATLRYQHELEEDIANGNAEPMEAFFC